MSTNSKEARFRRDMKRLDVHKTELAKPADQQDAKKLLKPFQLIRIRLPASSADDPGRSIASLAFAGFA